MFRRDLGFALRLRLRLRLRFRLRFRLRLRLRFRRRHRRRGQALLFHGLALTGDAFLGIDHAFLGRVRQLQVLLEQRDRFAGHASFLVRSRGVEHHLGLAGDREGLHEAFGRAREQAALEEDLRFDGLGLGALEIAAAGLGDRGLSHQEAHHQPSRNLAEHGQALPSESARGWEAQSGGKFKLHVQMVALPSGPVKPAARRMRGE